MTICMHHPVCSRDAHDLSQDGMCILHSPNPKKPKEEFKRALAKHRSTERGWDFRWFVFPDFADFKQSTFPSGADFSEATFTDRASFADAEFADVAFFTNTTFHQPVSFVETEFAKGALFLRATFEEVPSFRHTKFNDQSDFVEATFAKGATFDWARFQQGVDFFAARFRGNVHFGSATFHGRAGFIGTSFEAGTVSFRASRFAGRALFATGEAKALAHRTFEGVEVDFREVLIEEPGSVVFQGADFRRCHFRDTDLRRVQLTDVAWPRMRGGRNGVYDEVAPLDASNALNLVSFHQIISTHGE